MEGNGRVAHYACGNASQVGDIVRVIDAEGSGNPPILRKGTEHRVEAIIPDGLTSPCPFVVQIENHKPYDKFWTSRFELISRATPAPSAPEARGAEEIKSVVVLPIKNPGVDPDMPNGGEYTPDAPGGAVITGPDAERDRIVRWLRAREMFYDEIGNTVYPRGFGRAANLIEQNEHRLEVGSDQ